MSGVNITRLKLPAFRAFVESNAWAIDHTRGAALLEFLAARAEVRAPGSVNSRSEKIEARSGDRRPVTKSGGAIAVLPLYGPISQRMDMMMAYCGGTSTEAFADMFDAAMADPNVSAIVIDCDSPGGQVTGTPELAKRIFAARGKGKQIVAVANGMMASAAYWICSAADEIVATPSSDGVGSLGVFCVHVDQSAMNEMIGLKYTLIKAGEHKAETNPWVPLSAEAEAFLQSQVDEANGMFVSAVAKQRGTDTKTINADYGQGRCFTAKQALAAGMIDRIATLQETLTRLGARNVSASGRPINARTATPPLIAGEPVGDDTVDDQDDEDGNLCPDCGAELNDDGDCTSCEYTAAKSSVGASSEILPPAAGAVGQGLPLSPDPRPHAAKELMNEEEMKAAIAAERKRAADIRQLARDHSIDESAIDKIVDSGLSADGAATQILAQVKARHAADPAIRVGADREADRKFGSFGEQMIAIIQRTKLGRRDARLDRVNHHAMQIDRAGASEMMAGSPTGMNESVGSEGGFFIAPEVLPGVLEPVYTEDPILSRVKRIQIGSASNRTVYNVVDETARTDGSRWGGIAMQWADEADTATPKKPKLRQVEQLLKKIIGAGYLTDEMIQDAPAAQSLLMDAFTTELAFMLTSGIFRGVGGGQMLGFLKGKGGVQQAIEATQTIANTDQFLAKNVTKMLANIPASLWDDVIFLYQQELLPYFVTATVGGNTSVPLFIGAGGMTNKPFDTILGRPAFASEQCEAVGTPGDIVAIAPSQYHVAEKGGAQIATSLHVAFLSDQLVMRITYRTDGKPVWNSTVTPYKGANARGFFSTLAARA